MYRRLLSNCEQRFVATKKIFPSGGGSKQRWTGYTTRNLSSNGTNDPPLFLRLPSYIWFTAGGTTLLFGYCYYSYLDEVPLTKRKRWIATTPAGEKQLGDQEYKKLLQHFQKDILPSDHRAAITLRRVGKRITEASHELFGKQQQHQGNVGGTTPPQYTYTVVRSDVANAFVLPGNHVFLMTGLFKFVRDEDELAIILGHEIAHNVARHAGEKVSGSILINMLARLSLLLDPSGLVFTILLPSATLFRELPNSRVQEMEADEIGLKIAVEACYDPRAAKRVFLSMMNEEKGSGKGHTHAPPELLSTHPAYDTRLSNFDKWLPAAIDRYQSDMGERCGAIRKQMRSARQFAAEEAARRERAAASLHTTGSTRNDRTFI